MKIANAIKKMEKLGTVQNNKQQFWIEKDNGNRSLMVMRNGHSDEVAVIKSTSGRNSDYPASTYHKTLSSAIRCY